MVEALDSRVERLQVQLLAQAVSNLLHPHQLPLSLSLLSLRVVDSVSDHLDDIKY